MQQPGGLDGQFNRLVAEGNHQPQCHGNSRYVASFDIAMPQSLKKPNPSRGKWLTCLMFGILCGLLCGLTVYHARKWFVAQSPPADGTVFTGESRCKPAGVNIEVTIIKRSEAVVKVEPEAVEDKKTKKNPCVGTWQATWIWSPLSEDLTIVPSKENSECYIGFVGKWRPSFSWFGRQQLESTFVGSPPSFESDILCQDFDFVGNAPDEQEDQGKNKGDENEDENGKKKKRDGKEDGQDEKKRDNDEVEKDKKKRRHEKDEKKKTKKCGDAKKDGKKCKNGNNKEDSEKQKTPSVSNPESGNRDDSSGTITVSRASSTESGKAPKGGDDDDKKSMKKSDEQEDDKEYSEKKKEPQQKTPSVSIPESEDSEKQKEPQQKTFSVSSPESGNRDESSGTNTGKEPQQKTFSVSSPESGNRDESSGTNTGASSD